MNIPLLVAHRGYMEAYPENSLSGLEAALQAGAPYIEFDIQSTADGELVVIHEPDLQRTTGRSGSVLDLRYCDLASISAHEPARFGERFAPTPIPRLSDVIHLLSRYPYAQALVEIKSEAVAEKGLQPIVDRLLADIAPAADQCTLIGYGIETLRHIRSRSSLPIGWVIARYDEETHTAAQRLRPDIMIGEVHMFTPDESPWPGPWTWMLYDITDPALALAYADNGVALIETRDVGGMYRNPILARRRLEPAP